MVGSLGQRAHDLNNTGFQFRLHSHVLPSLDSNEEEQRRIRRPQSPGDTRHSDHTHNEGFMTRQQDGQSAWLIVRAR